MRTLGHDRIGTEHLLLGLLRGGNELVIRALTPLTRDDVVAQLERGGQQSTGQVPFTVAAKTALEQARASADALRHSWVGTEHLLLGLVAVDDTATRILRDRGFAPEEVRAAVLRELGGG